MNAVYLKSLSFNITTPIKMHLQDIQFSALTLMTSINSTGKSFIMKCGWALSYTSVSVNILKRDNIVYNPMLIAQDIFDNTFTDHNITGTISGNYSPDISISITFEEGKVTALNHSELPENHIAFPVKYMSSDMHTFDSISKYLGMRNMIPKDKDTVMEMLKCYKLYDVVAVERLILSCPILLVDRREYLRKMGIVYEINSIDVDLERGDFYMLCDTDRKTYLSTLGKGEQSIINMCCTI